MGSTMYKQIIGSLMYLNTIRPNLMCPISLISRYMKKPTEKHLVVAKRILKYLRGTTDLGICYKKDKGQQLKSYCDSDYVGILMIGKTLLVLCFSRVIMELCLGRPRSNLESLIPPLRQSLWQYHTTYVKVFGRRESLRSWESNRDNASRFYVIIARLSNIMPHDSM